MNKAQIKILQTAARLFYKQGYQQTGVSDILRESGTHKASFYKYYHDKEELGEQYLNLVREINLNQIRGLLEKNPQYEAFVRAWSAFVKHQVRRGKMYGCPFALLSNQRANQKSERAEPTPPNFLVMIQEQVHEWERMFTDYLSAGAMGQPLSPDHAKRIARRIIIIYQGILQSHYLSDDLAYLDEMEASLLALA